MSQIKDTYLTISGLSKGAYKEKGSKFLSYITAAVDQEEVDQFLDNVKSEHPKARHHCYAYRLGVHGQTFRFNDDGEPSGTAGRPILSQLKSFNLTNIVAVVVRYFGGTKLGASGLVTAYKESTKDALKHAKVVTKTLEQQFSVSCKYKDLPMLMEAIKYAEITIIKKIFEKEPNLIISIPLSKQELKWNEVASKFIGHNANLDDLKEFHVDIKEIEFE